MSPSEWRNMLSEFRQHLAALPAQFGEGAFEINRVPQDDRRDQEVKA
jgi:hypothetical protein